jgi:hypothetical protein
MGAHNFRWWVLGVAMVFGAGRGLAGEEGTPGTRVFGVVDLSAAAQRAPEGLRGEVERWAAGRGVTRLSDAGIQRALAGGEAAGPAVARMVALAGAKQDAGDCAGAVALAGTAETQALATLTVDEERESLKSVYAVLIGCQHRLGHLEQARAAGVRLRTLVSLPPSGLPQAMWDSYVAVKPEIPAPVELVVDSDPPNARVAINFHVDGVTPHTVRVAPGIVYVEVEKAGFKKAFRAVTVDKTPARVVFSLVDRRQDRAVQVESAIARLRGSDPLTHPTTLARLAELARVDVLVAIMVNAQTVKVWWFDADRGDLIGDPVESRFDPQTGRLLGRGPARAADPAPAKSP